MECLVSLKEKSYKVIIERGILKNINSYFDFAGNKVLIITDDHVPSIYLHTLLKTIPNSLSFVFEHGELSKSFDTFIKIQEFLLNNSFNRNDVVIALGGGVVGDLSGFVASTYKRGLKFINIPTTTLAQIDSSVGGKTAINFMNTKNIIGSFYQPEIVLIDLDTLETLDERNINNGLVEALKMGLCLDKDLYRIFKEGRQYQDLEEVIYRSVKLKARIVEEDEKEKHLRMVLNFGHSLAHPLESYYSLNSEILHGEAVAEGMLYMIDNPCLKMEVKRIITENLNIKLKTNLDESRLMNYLTKDKKVDNEQISIVTLNDVEDYKITKVSFNEVLKRLEGGF